MTEISDNPIPPAARTPTNAGSSGDASSRVGAAAAKAGDEASAVKDEAMGAAADMKDRAKGEVANLAGEARDQTRSMLHEVRGQLDGQADDAARRIGSAIASAADELRTMAASSDRPDSPIASAVRELADRSAGVAETLESRGYRGVADDLARFGRNRAGLFLLAAGAAGFAVGRILRNTDTSAVVQAAKDEATGGSGDASPTGEPMSLPAADEPVLTAPGAPSAPATTGMGVR